MEHIFMKLITCLDDLNNDDIRIFNTISSINTKKYKNIKYQNEYINVI